MFLFGLVWLFVLFSPSEDLSDEHSCSPVNNFKPQCQNSVGMPLFIPVPRQDQIRDISFHKHRWHRLSCLCQALLWV